MLRQQSDVHTTRIHRTIRVGLLSVLAVLVALSLLVGGGRAGPVECKRKAFGWYGECWSRFEGQEFTRELRRHGVNPWRFAHRWPQLARVFRGDWPGPKPWSEAWLLERVDAAWPDVAAWTRIAVCESGQNPPNWQHNSGTYQGGLGFYRGSWDAFRPSHFPSEAYAATPAQQMWTAERIYDAYALTGWGCRGVA